MTKNRIVPKNPGERNRDEEKIKDYEVPMESMFGDDSYSTERFDASTHVDQLSRVGDVESEKAILVGVYLPDQGKQPSPLGELTGLAEAAGVIPLGTMIQRRTTPDPACYLGKGKVDELEEMVNSSGANVVLFDNELAPGQTRNLEQKLKIKVLDRTELILDIFATRARTHEACLAVELAQLEYSMPRLRRMWTHLERQSGGSVGLRGPGEKQLEVDRRIAQKKISLLKDELSRIQDRRQREVKSRSGSKTVCLVGYTNAGKSTLLNRLTTSDVFAQDMLFATLDTRTRRWTIPGWGPILLSDTVGFIRDLPHHLVASFEATLSEAISADLLIHVSDASNPEVCRQIESACKVLTDLGIRDKNTVLVLNKIDRISSKSDLDLLLQEHPSAIPISATDGAGLDQLTAAVSAALSREFQDIYVETSLANGRIAAMLAREGEVLSREYLDEKVIFHCRMPDPAIGRLLKEKEVVVRGATISPEKKW